MTPEANFEKALREKLPEHTADTFSEAQIHALYRIFGDSQWKKHPVDLRATLGVWRWRYYVRLVAGRDKRALTRREQQLGLAMRILLIVGVAAVSTLLGLLLIYLGKSGLGIDVIPNFSFGIWGWFKDTFPALTEWMTHH